MSDLLGSKKHAWRFGERHPNAKLTDDLVRAIRREPKGASLRTLAHKYGVSRMTISAVRRGNIWRHVK